MSIQEMKDQKAQTDLIPSHNTTLRLNQWFLHTPPPKIQPLSKKENKDPKFIFCLPLYWQSYQLQGIGEKTECCSWLWKRVETLVSDLLKFSWKGVGWLSEAAEWEYVTVGEDLCKSETNKHTLKKFSVAFCKLWTRAPVFGCYVRFRWSDNARC